MRMLIVVAFFAVLLFIARIILKRAKRNMKPGGGARNGITVVATTPLAANRSLHVIQIGERNLLVGATDGGISTIAELTADEVAALGAAEPASGRMSFASALASATSTRLGKQSPAAAFPRRSLVDWIRERTVR
jgi:flagellar biosynthetic protein FliO